MITFEDEDDDGFEEGGGGAATPLPKIPMTIGKTFPSMTFFFFERCLVFKSTQTRLTLESNPGPYIGKIIYPKRLEKVNDFKSGRQVVYPVSFANNGFHCTCSQV